MQAIGFLHKALSQALPTPHSPLPTLHRKRLSAQRGQYDAVSHPTMKDAAVVSTKGGPGKTTVPMRVAMLTDLKRCMSPGYLLVGLGCNLGGSA